MSNTIRIKRRGSGAPGAPSTLENAELAYNEVDNTLYYGKGTGGAGGSATTIEAIAGAGAMVTLTTTQTISGAKTFSVAPVLPAMLASDNSNNAASTKFVKDQAYITAAGNVATATALATGRTISLTGDATGTSAAFDGTSAVSITVVLANTTVTPGTYPKVTVDAKGRVTTGAALVAADIPVLDAGKITTGTFADARLSGIYTAVSIGGNAATATALATGRVFSVTGDATGSSAAFDGSAAASIALTLANSGVTAGTYTKITVDAKGRAIVGATLAAGDIPTLTASKISDFDTQVRLSRLDQMAVPTASVSLNNQKITLLADPSIATDAATKGYVDTVAQGLSPRQSVRVATTANITLSGTQTIDGTSLIAGDRVLVKNQTTPSQNGIYVVAAGAWARSTDANTWTKLVSSFLFVETGATLLDTAWLCIVDQGGTLDTTAVTYTQWVSATDLTAGNGLVRTGNVIDIQTGAGVTITTDAVALTGQALALHNLASNGMVVRTGAGTVAARSIAVTGTAITITNGDGVSANPTLALTAALESIGNLTPVANRIAYYTGASTAALQTTTSFGLGLLNTADGAALRTAGGLGTISTQNANAVAITGGTIDGVVFDGGTF